MLGWQIQAIRLCGFYHENPGPEACEIHTAQGCRFMPFHVDFQKMDIARCMLFANLR